MITFNSLKLLILFSFFGGCRKESVQNVAGQVDIAPTSNPTSQTIIPQDKIVDPLCPPVGESASLSPIDENKAEISFILKDLSEDQEPQVAVLNSSGAFVSTKRKCTKSYTHITLEVEPQDARVKIFAREKNSGLVFTLENVTLAVGKNTNLGLIQGSKSGLVKGKILNSDGTDLKGEIQELNWTFNVENDGQWQTGPLPSGQWSIKISDGQKKLARWLKLPCGLSDVITPEVSLSQNNPMLSPLWSGELKSPYVSLLVTVPEEATEMRISYHPGFANSLWTPIRQTVSLPVPSSGRHLIFSQYRTFSGEESEIVASEINAKVLELNSTADAKLKEKILSVFNPSTIIETIPPEGASMHSVTVGSDDLPALWEPISVPLTLRMPAQIESCGQHTAFIRFKDSEGNESASLNRIFFVRCWERDIPSSPLEPRYNHGATHLSIENTQDAVFIWGGQNENQQYFSNGAILRQKSEEIVTQSDGTTLTKPIWEWHFVADSPLSPRSHPKIVAGKNNVLIYGGFAPNGDVLGDWAFYNFRTDTWESNNGYHASSMPPVALKNTSVGYILAEGSTTKGGFLIVGGELPNQPNSTTMSQYFYALMEDNGVLDKRWWRAVFSTSGLSRANSIVSPQNNLLLISGGITAPSGVPTTSSPDLSGSDFDTNANVFAFVIYSYSFYPFYPFSYKYNSTGGKKTSAMFGHSFLVSRTVSATATATTKIESQSMCVFGGQKYTDEFPEVCHEARNISGLQYLYQPFCRRLYDAYVFAPVGKVGICFQPKSGYFQNNFVLAISGAPGERRLSSVTSPIYIGESSQGALFYWSGMAATGSEFLSDGAVFLARDDKWVPITSFEAPTPRNYHSSIFLKSKKRIFVWGGLTAAGATSGGGFYALP